MVRALVACLLSASPVVAGEVRETISGQSIVLELPRSHASKVGVLAPTGEWLFVIDRSLKNPLMSEEAFLATSELRLDARTTRASRFENGVEVSAPLFAKSGRYVFFVSENLETQIENMRAISIGVEYNPFHPDAPLEVQSGEGLKFAVVSGVETFRRIRGGTNTYPWHMAGPGEVIVSNSCGFAEVEYRRVTTPAYSSREVDEGLKPWKAFVHLGEWCGMQDFILDRPTLVAYRDWKGKHYLVNFAHLRMAEDDRYFIDDSEFIEFAGLIKHMEGPEHVVFLSAVIPRTGSAQSAR